MTDFPEPDLAHDPQRLGGLDRQRDAVDGPDDLVLRVEPGAEILDSDEGVGRRHAAGFWVPPPRLSTRIGLQGPDLVGLAAHAPAACGNVQRIQA